MKRYPALFVLLILMSSTAKAQQLGPVSRWATIAASEFQVHPNIVYGKANNVNLRLDVITVDRSKDPRPTVIYIHGGGWVGWTKEETELRVLPYLARGMNAVNVEYRLASVSLAPAAVEDCRCALRWVYDHATEYGFDTTKLVVAGESAGGHLSLMTGMLTPSAGFDDECPGHVTAGEPEEMRVAAIVDYFGITDVPDVLQGPNARSWALMWFAGLPNRLVLAKRLSPLTYVRKGLPPIIILHGDKDPTVPYQEAVRLHEALNAASVPNQLVTIHGGGHDGWTREQNLRAQAAIFHFLETHGILRQ